MRATVAMASYSRDRAIKRKVGIVLLGILLVVLAFVAAYVVRSITDPSAVTYKTAVIYPQRYDLCYGDELTYQTEMVVHRAPVVLHVVENYCQPGPQGLCFRATVSEYNLAINETKNLTATVRRIIPASSLLVPGKEFVLSHVAEDGAVTGYQVPFRIRDDCSLPEGP